MKLTAKEYSALYKAIYERQKRIKYLIELIESYDAPFNEDVIESYNDELKTLETLRLELDA